ncbi:TPA: hypothetical protein N0F65_007951 [Lagenidium giganteum]|uniref:Uncharacterized protein n=1 Tax=Lagenidium giganteum TaxID=4803 RepID=A0AAV2YH01_9STRA|nr:TPA: hypothetical protein N0F65_007951 [Lagenidium giganteum]
MSALVGAGNYAEAGAFNLPMVIATSIPSIFFARLGVRVAHRISSQRLAKLAGCGMLLAAPCVALKDTPYSFEAFLASAEDQLQRKALIHPLDIQRHYNPALNSNNEEQDTVATIPKTVWEHACDDPVAFLEANTIYAVVGAAAGFVSGLLGVGGAMFTSAYLTTATDMPQPVVIGTTLVAIVPTAIASSYFNL